jgi:hypothetical protein
VPPPINNPYISQQIQQVASMTLGAYDRGMAFYDARALGLNGLRSIEGLADNPVARFAEQAVAGVGSDQTGYQIAKTTFQRPEALDPYTAPDAKVRGISAIATASFDTGMTFTDARSVGNAALRAIDQVSPNPVAAFALDAAAQAGSDQEAYNMQRAALDRPELMTAFTSPQTQVANIAQLAIADFDKGMRFSTARQVGDAALARIQQASGSGVAGFVRQAARDGSSDQEAYNIQRAALEQPALFGPAYPQQQSRAIAQLALAAFDKGMLFSSARQVGMDALQAVQAQGYNALAAMAMSSAAGAYSDQDAYNIERQALQAIANG